MKTFRRLLLLGAALLEVGCGLPDTYYLQPPSVVTLAPGGNPGEFVFSNPQHDINSDINVNFTGNELYYKFYDDISEIEINAYDSSNPSDPSVQLTAKGFYPVAAITDIPPNRLDPVIPILEYDLENGTSLVADGSTVTVSITSNSASNYSIPSGPAGNICRDAPSQSSPTTYKDFENNDSITDNYISGDADVVSMLAGGSPIVYVAMYALSFGYTGTSTPQRSVPTYLGYVQIAPFP